MASGGCTAGGGASCAGAVIHQQSSVLEYDAGLAHNFDNVQLGLRSGLPLVYATWAGATRFANHRGSWSGGAPQSGYFVPTLQGGDVVRDTLDTGEWLDIYLHDGTAPAHEHADGPRYVGVAHAKSVKAVVVMLPHNSFAFSKSASAAVEKFKL